MTDEEIKNTLNLLNRIINNLTFLSFSLLKAEQQDKKIKTLLDKIKKLDRKVKLLTQQTGKHHLYCPFRSLFRGSQSSDNFQ